MVFLVFVFAVAVGFVALALVRLSGSGGGGGSDEGGGSDDGPPRGWRGPRPKPRGPEPVWWPEFEREFRSYVRTQDARTPVSGAH
jgi:hypothetical protein